MICPKTQKECVEIECSQWCILFHKNEKEESIADGKCAIAWIPILLVELKDALNVNNIKKN